MAGQEWQAGGDEEEVAYQVQLGLEFIGEESIDVVETYESAGLETDVVGLQVRIGRSEYHISIRKNR